MREELREEVFAVWTERLEEARRTDAVTDELARHLGAKLVLHRVEDAGLLEDNARVVVREVTDHLLA